MVVVVIDKGDGAEKTAGMLLPLPLSLLETRSLILGVFFLGPQSTTYLKSLTVMQEKAGPKDQEVVIGPFPFPWGGGQVAVFLLESCSWIGAK